MENHPANSSNSKVRRYYFVYYEPRSNADGTRGVAVAQYGEDLLASWLIIAVALQHPPDVFSRETGKFWAFRYLKRAVKKCATFAELSTHPHIFAYRLPLHSRAPETVSTETVYDYCDLAIDEYRYKFKLRQVQWFIRKYTRLLEKKAKQMQIDDRVNILIENKTNT